MTIIWSVMFREIIVAWFVYETIPSNELNGRNFRRLNVKERDTES
jgi:hypothetical protein